MNNNILLGGITLHCANGSPVKPSIHVQTGI